MIFRLFSRAEREREREHHSLSKSKSMWFGGFNTSPGELIVFTRYVLFGWGRMIGRNKSTHAELLHFMGVHFINRALPFCTAGTGRPDPDNNTEVQHNKQTAECRKHQQYVVSVNRNRFYACMLAFFKINSYCLTKIKVK